MDEKQRSIMKKLKQRNVADVVHGMTRDEVDDMWDLRKREGHAGFLSDIEHFQWVKGPSDEFHAALDKASELLASVHASLQNLHVTSVETSAQCYMDVGDKEGDVHLERLWRARQRSAAVAKEAMHTK